MKIDGIDFNVIFWKGKTKKQFLTSLSPAYPDKDLEKIYYLLFPKTKKIEETENEGAS